jgi:hypothetical protein
VNIWGWHVKPSPARFTDKMSAVEIDEVCGDYEAARSTRVALRKASGSFPKNGTR